MHQLRLKAAEVEQETDSLPFPRPVSRIGAWQPRPLWQPHEAEEALARVQANLDRLGLCLNPPDPDRPRAA